MIKAILFDLDGVIFDTEPLYTRFWGEQCKIYFPEKEGLEQVIKGQTLTQIYSTLFLGMEDEQKVITDRLNAFEESMPLAYIAGFPDFIASLRNVGLKTAIVTSSNNAKMEKVFRAHPELHGWFDAFVTAESCSKSKPAPDCYLKGAEMLGLKAEECIGFEDSINGLKAVRSAGMRVVGLATSNPREVVAPLADVVIDNYENFSVESLRQLFPDAINSR